MNQPNAPEYNKPSSPGIAMNFDNTVSIYHIVGPDDSFDTAAQAMFGLIISAQKQFPDWPRMFYLDIAGHADEKHGFTDDMIELQQELFFSTMAPFLTAFELPLTGPLLNPNAQRNDLPDALVIGND